MSKQEGLLPPLWICPRCGHALAGRNMSHSCGQFDLEAHFSKRPPRVRQLFNALRTVIEDIGPVTVEPQKTRIVFTVRVRFVAVTVQQSGLKAHLWLTRRVPDARFRIETFTPTAHIHHFKVTDASQLDDPLKGLLREAYAVGCQEHRL
jgi:predicted transport protein